MYTLNKLEYWADHHHPKWIEYLRIILGIILVIKGIAFIGNKTEVILMLKESSSEFISFLIAHYVIAAYIAGGLAVGMGLFTRLAILTILPVIVGSIIFIDLHRNLFALNSEIGYSVLTLALLLFYLFYGSGAYSADFFLDQKNVNEKG